MVDVYLLQLQWVTSMHFNPFYILAQCTMPPPSLIMMIMMIIITFHISAGCPTTSLSALGLSSYLGSHKSTGLLLRVHNCHCCILT